MNKCCFSDVLACVESVCVQVSPPPLLLLRTILTPLQCDNDCIRIYNWCNPTASDRDVKCSLPGVDSVIDVRFAGDVCLDRQFWEGHDCGDRWERCTGITSSQCYYSSDKCVRKVGAGTCEDKSHLVCDRGEATGEEVCTRDEEEMFSCVDNSTCIHQKLLCDGTPQCKYQHTSVHKLTQHLVFNSGR